MGRVDTAAMARPPKKVELFLWLKSALHKDEDVRQYVEMSAGYLSPNQEIVLECRYGLRGRGRHTLSETAQVYCTFSPYTGRTYSGERMRQIEATALFLIVEQRFL